MSRPSHQPAASAAGESSDAEFDPVFGPGFPDPFEAITARTVPPPCAVNIERAMTEGRRARQRRAIGVTSGAAAGLAAIAVCVAGLLATTSGSGAVRTQTADSALPITSADPFVAGAGFGWLPDGVEQDGLSLVHGSFLLSAGNSLTAGGSGDSETSFSLRTFPPDSSEQSALAAIASGEGTIPTTATGRVTARVQPPIGGKPAYTVTDSAPVASNVREVTLLWQMSNGRWAELSEIIANSTAGATGTDPTTLTAQARHVAEAVTPDAAGEALPFSITGLPSGALITSYSLGLQNASPTSWNAEIGIEVAGVALVYDEGPVGEVLPVTLGPSKCTTRNGLEACVTLASGHLSDRFPAGGLQALADDVSLRAPARATWTTDIFPDH